METVYMMLICWLFLGMVAVASNPSPPFAILGIVFVGADACTILAVHGTPILALVLFLIYLGGMLVVFCFTSALAADPFPDDWFEATVFESVALLVIGTVVTAMYIGPPMYKWTLWFLGAAKEFVMARVDMGIAFLYGPGFALTIQCAIALTMVLLVILELVRGRKRGGMRAP
nr:NADH dehydrogenase subunit 6 [Harengula humeralis]